MLMVSERESHKDCSKPLIPALPALTWCPAIQPGGGQWWRHQPQPSQLHFASHPERVPQPLLPRREPKHLHSCHKARGNISDCTSEDSRWNWGQTPMTPCRWQILTNEDGSQQVTVTNRPATDNQRCPIEDGGGNVAKLFGFMINETRKWPRNCTC